MRKSNDFDRLEIEANNQEREEVKSFKLLGVYIDCQLLWEDQISNISNCK